MMFRDELSPFLREVLDAVGRSRAGVAADTWGQPEPEDVARLATELRADEDDVRQALMGLRALDCFEEHAVEFAGVQLALWWTVHPQCTVETIEV